jgi:hypothetical protein
MEIDTAVRHGAKAVFVVSNNAAWNIERYDQEANYGGRVVGHDAAALRLRGDGPGARPPRRARRGPGRAQGRAGAGARERAGPGRRGHLAGGGVVGRAQGARASCRTTSRSRPGTTRSASGAACSRPPACTPTRKERLP